MLSSAEREWSKKVSVCELANYEITLKWIQEVDVPSSNFQSSEEQYELRYGI